MSTSINEFNDILNAEVHIDLDKLRESSRHGVPMEIRGVNISSFGLSFLFFLKKKIDAYIRIFILYLYIIFLL
jgi:hypothetical protein